MNSLRYKVGVSYLGLVAITLATGVFAAYSFSRLGSSVGRVLLENYGSVLAAENMVKALERQEHARLLFLSGDSTQARLAFLEHRDRFWHWYGGAVTGAVLPEEPALLDSIEVAYDRYLTASEALFQETGPMRVLRDRRLHLDATVSTLVTRLRTLNLRLLEVNQDAMVTTRLRVETQAQTATTAVLGFALLAAVLSLLAGLYFTRTFIHPVERLTRTVRLIGRGRLDLKVDIHTNDEVEELGREFNQMTERLQAYEVLNVQQLIAEKKKSESLVATMPSPVIVTDAADRVLILNEAAILLLGIDRESWQERPLSDVVIDAGLLDHLSGRPHPLPAPEAARLPAPDYVFALHRAGRVQYYRRRQSYIEPDEHGGLTVTLLEDVTRFKELDRLKSDFLAAVSHELRTPLTSLGIAVELLLQEVPGTLNNMQRELLQTVNGDQARLKKLVNNLLDLARLESGTYVPASEPVHLAGVIEDALAPLRLPFQEKGVGLQTCLPADLAPVTGEAQHLGWVVTNLVGNALRYTPAGGLVTVEARQDAGAICVAVRDTGAGIPPESLDAIFDMFVQLKASNESTPGSLGLGLALARRVIEAHGGRIWAESTPGHGSTFCFTLPAPFNPSAYGTGDRPV